MKKRILSIGIAIVILFAVAGLVACNNDTLTLRDEVNAVGEQVTYLQNGGTATTADLDALLAEIDALKARVAKLEAENAELLAELVDLRQEVQNMVDTKEAERLSADFVLNISVQSATLQFGQNIAVTATFKNQSGEGVDLSHTQSWIMPFIAEWYELDGVLDVNRTVVDDGDSVTRVLHIGSRLPRGRHVLTTTATFDVLLFEGTQIVGAKPFRIESNKIVLTVA